MPRRDTLSHASSFPHSPVAGFQHGLRAWPHRDPGLFAPWPHFMRLQ